MSLESLLALNTLSVLLFLWLWMVTACRPAVRLAIGSCVWTLRGAMTGAGAGRSCWGNLKAVLMPGGAVAGAGENAEDRKSSPPKVGDIVGLSVTDDGGESAVDPKLSLTCMASDRLKLRALGLWMLCAGDMAY